MDEAHSNAAWSALQKAIALRDKASPVERSLIDALKARYAMPIPKDRAPLDKAYAEAMKPVFDANPKDADIATLYAESLMDLRPWDLWSKTGEPRPETPLVLAALERAMSIDPDHPGACHLYIHAVEASPQPERAEAAADRLRKLVPGSGHLVHMPAHIDVRTGKWDQAATSNVNAMRADAAYYKLSPKQGFYRLYMGHNAHFLAYACMMEGRQAEGLRAAQGMIAGVPADFLATSGAIVDGLMTADLEVLKRFGKWEDILRHQGPPKGLPIANAMWHFHRGVAQAALGRVAEAESEQAEFRKAVKAVPEGAMMMINPAARIFEIGEHVLAGEIAYRKGALDEAIRELRQGVVREDELRYMEPPEWVTPVRHTLGAILLEAGKIDDAEQVYRADLKYWPRNAWSLFGVGQCLKARNAPGAAEAVAQFERAWTRADTQITSTCLCVKGKS
jgi:tetratricopeptide (TPR) repeat protein